MLVKDWLDGGLSVGSENVNCHIGSARTWATEKLTTGVCMLIVG